MSFRPRPLDRLVTLVERYGPDAGARRWAENLAEAEARSFALVVGLARARQIAAGGVTQKRERRS